VIVDATGRVPASGPLFEGGAPTLIATTTATPEARLREWSGAGAEVLILEREAGGSGVALASLLHALGKRDVQGVLIEGGATLAWSFVRNGLVDDVVVYVAPTLIGGSTAPGALGGSGFAPIEEALALKFDGAERIGDDIRLEAHVHRDR
jgi:diaminohydroxyphosphoribosylaminopyrimidine deaminase / 5-amino-6-(5-phosphoribosylamino)uracil reductase